MPSPDSASGPARAIVTGGAGFIGSHLVDALIDRGDEVLVVDDLSTGRRSNLEGALERGAELSEGSLTAPDFLTETLERFRPAQIYHLAAQVDVRKAVADPGFDAAVNVLGTINLLEAACRLPSVGVVFASTGGAIYGEGRDRPLPFAEDATAAPESAYGSGKLAAEVYLGCYRRLHRLPSVALRFGNVYGPRQDPHGEAGVVAIFAGLLRSGTPLRIFGDGKQTRDYVYVADVVAALLAGGDALVERGTEVAGPYNVGTGVEVEVNELALLLAEIASTEAQIEYLPERAGEVRRAAVDPGAAARDLGWSAEVDIGEGLRRTYDALAEESSSTEERSAKTA